MAIATDVYSLYAALIPGEGNPRTLLTRVTRRDFSNADQEDEDSAESGVEEAESALITHYWRQIFGMDAPSELNKIGEMQGHPAGEILEFAEETMKVNIWIAESAFGPPWLVLGTADSEDDFWRLIESDPDLAALKPTRPARRTQTCFLPASRNV